MYIIKPVNPSDVRVSNFIDDDMINKMKITNYIFIADIDLLKRLSKINLPIKNNRLATIRILEFVSFLDLELHKNDDETLIQIPWKTFEDFFTKNKATKYKEILRKLKIITCVPYEDGSFYSYGDQHSESNSNKCMQFRVHKGYLQPKNLGLVIFNPTRKLKSTPSVCNEVHDLDEKFVRTIATLKIDIYAAINAEFDYFRNEHQNLFRLKTRISIILRTERDRFIRTGKNVDRIYHTFSNVPRLSRKYFNISFNNIDVKNCQPLLLVSVLNNNLHLCDQNYKEDCEDSLFYQRFIGIKGLDKEQIKIRLYKSVFFGFNKRAIVNKKFKELYPATWQSLADLKQQKISLAAELQNLESSLFNCIIPSISHYYFTLFDAIYFTDFDDAKNIIDQIKTFFMKLGVDVQLRINDEEVKAVVN